MPYIPARSAERGPRATGADQSRASEHTVLAWHPYLHEESQPRPGQFVGVVACLHHRDDTAITLTVSYWLRIESDTWEMRHNRSRKSATPTAIRLASSVRPYAEREVT